MPDQIQQFNTSLETEPDRTASQVDSTSAGYQLDDLVDKVVERIEQRVIDELERRGRRHGSGAF